MDTRTQAWVDAGFLDPTADDFDEMCEVLLWYEDLGFGPDEFAALLAEAPERDVPASRAAQAKTNGGRADIINVVNERFLRPGKRYSAEEARQALGLEEGKFQRMIAAGGYNPREQFTQLDIDGFAAFAASESLFSDEELLHFTRVLSTAMSRVADASTSLFQFDVASHIEAGGGSLLDWAQANYVAAQLVDSIFEPMRSLFLHELVGSVRRTDYARENRLDQDNRSTVRLAVGFVDIVGYTPLTERLSADELATFIRDFEELVSTVVTSRHDGRIVKLIGDEVMFIAVTPDQACAIASDLVTAFAGTEPSLGVALALGTWSPEAETSTGEWSTPLHGSRRWQCLAKCWWTPPPKKAPSATCLRARAVGS